MVNKLLSMLSSNSRVNFRCWQDDNIQDANWGH